MKIALDVDGVIADFYLAMAAKYDMPYVSINQWSLDWIEQRFSDVIGDVQFWANIPILNRPEKLDFEYHCYLSAFPKAMYAARKLWLKKNGYANVPLFCDNDKVRAMRQHNIDVLIDDKPQNCIDVENAGLIAIQYIPFYFEIEPSCKYYVKDLSEVSKVIERISNI